MPVDLCHLRCVVAAAELGSFRRAGRALGAEQSAISRRIREVEGEIGAQLFHRCPSGVELTDLGKAFLQKVELGARQIDTAIQGAKAAAVSERCIRVGVFGPLSLGFLPELFASFRNDRPKAKLRFSEGSSHELIAAVRRGQIDVGVVAEAAPGRGYALSPLWTDPVFLALPEGDALAVQQAIRWHDLRHRHFVLTDLPTGDFAKSYLERHLKVPSATPRIEQLSVTRESLMQIVVHGGGVTIAGSAHTRLGLPGITFRRIEGATLRYGAVHSTGLLSRDLESLLALAKSLSEKEQAWFARQRLIRPEHRRVLHADRHRGARGRTPDLLQ